MKPSDGPHGYRVLRPSFTRSLINEKWRKHPRDFIQSEKFSIRRSSQLKPMNIITTVCSFPKTLSSKVSFSQGFPIWWLNISGSMKSFDEYFSIGARCQRRSVCNYWMFLSYFLSTKLRFDSMHRKVRLSKQFRPNGLKWTQLNSLDRLYISISDSFK